MIVYGYACAFNVCLSVVYPFVRVCVYVCVAKYLLDHYLMTYSHNEYSHEDIKT